MIHRIFWVLVVLTNATTIGNWLTVHSRTVMNVSWIGTALVTALGVAAFLAAPAATQGGDR